MKHYVREGAFEALAEAIAMFNLSEEDEERFLHGFYNGDAEYEEVGYRTLNAYDGRVYIIKCSIYGENTLAIGIPFADGPSGEVDNWKYLHIYPETTPWNVQKLYQISDGEVVDVVAELFGNVGQLRPQRPSKALSEDESKWIEDNFRVQGV